MLQEAGVTRHATQFVWDGVHRKGVYYFHSSKRSSFLHNRFVCFSMHADQPDNDGGVEHYIAASGRGWNDLPDSKKLSSYVCERGAFCWHGCRD